MFIASPCYSRLFEPLLERDFPRQADTQDSKQSHRECHQQLPSWHPDYRETWRWFPFSWENKKNTNTISTDKIRWKQWNRNLRKKNKNFVCPKGLLPLLFGHRILWTYLGKSLNGSKQGWQDSLLILKASSSSCFGNLDLRASHLWRHCQVLTLNTLSILVTECENSNQCRNHRVSPILFLSTSPLLFSFCPSVVSPKTNKTTKLLFSIQKVSVETQLFHTSVCIKYFSFVTRKRKTQERRTGDCLLPSSSSFILVRTRSSVFCSKRDWTTFADQSVQGDCRNSCLVSSAFRKQFSHQKGGILLHKHQEDKYWRDIDSQGIGKKWSVGLSLSRETDDNCHQSHPLSPKSRLCSCHEKKRKKERSSFSSQEQEKKEKSSFWSSLVNFLVSLEIDESVVLVVLK